MKSSRVLLDKELLATKKSNCTSTLQPPARYPSRGRIPAQPVPNGWMLHGAAGAFWLLLGAELPWAWQPARTHASDVQLFTFYYKNISQAKKKS